MFDIKEYTAILDRFSTHHVADIFGERFQGLFRAHDSSRLLAQMAQASRGANTLADRDAEHTEEHRSQIERNVRYPFLHVHCYRARRVPWKSHFHRGTANLRPDRATVMSLFPQRTSFSFISSVANGIGNTTCFRRELGGNGDRWMRPNSARNRPENY